MPRQLSEATPRAFTAEAYDLGWREWSDFIRYNPGARHRRRITLKILQSLRFNRLLDVGCGSAEFLRCVHARLGGQVTLEGADLSPEVVADNTRRFAPISFHVLDLERARLSERYDMIVCSEVIEHLDDQRTAFGNLASMMAPGGHLLLTCPTGRMYPTERHFGHTHHPTVTELSAHANAAGINLILARCWGFPTYSLMKWVQNINSRWALQHFACGSYTMTARFVSSALYVANFLNAPSPWGPQLFVLFRRPG